MAVSTRSYSRPRDYSKLFIALAVLAAVVAIAPIAAAVLGYGSKVVTPKTAFASAPSGDYAVLGRSDGDADVISVAWAANPGAVTELVRVPHLPGFTSTGAVSPDGKKLALVSVDGGSPSHPTASLNVVGLETGLLSRAAVKIAPGQTPVWDPSGERVVVTRFAGGSDSPGAVSLFSVAASGKDETLLATFGNALGVYPVGFASGTNLVSVIIDGNGSRLRVGSKDAGSISTEITRDWRLSPDGSQLAFIESSTANGVQYLARTISLDGGGDVSAQSLSAAVSALGTAWNPATKTATFGVEPGASIPGVSAQALSSAAASATPGFDVPMGYSGDGQDLLVTRWSGSSFQDPGKPVLQLVTPDGRTNYDSFTRFYGWSAR
ncbi:MAG: hypothetical protein ABI577_07485 [bacterium]